MGRETERERERQREGELWGYFNQLSLKSCITPHELKGMRLHQEINEWEYQIGALNFFRGPPHSALCDWPGASQCVVFHGLCLKARQRRSVFHLYWTSVYLTSCFTLVVSVLFSVMYLFLLISFRLFFSLPSKLFLCLCSDFCSCMFK